MAGFASGNALMANGREPEGSAAVYVVKRGLRQHDSSELPMRGASTYESDAAGPIRRGHGSLFRFHEYLTQASLFWTSEVP